MREIWFRAKTNTNKWVYGNYYICDRQPAIQMNFLRYFINPNTLGQYTGLKDKNGTKIFEGDIIAHEYRDGTRIIDGVMKYGKFNCSCCDGVYGWYIDNGDIRELEAGEYTRLVVIGNIYDNPELLEG